MASAYTPGLKVSEKTIITKERRLPLMGNVVVKKGDRVKFSDIVAKTDLPGNVELVNVASKLSVEPKELREYMMKKEGDPIRKGDPIAQCTSFFGFFKTLCPSPCDGTLESISTATGQVVIRQNPTPVEIKAFVDGIIDEIIPNEGVVIKTFGTYIQGIFGIGGETVGELITLAKSPDSILDDSLITSAHEGKIIVGGSLITAAAIKKAIACKAKGIIVGGIDDETLRNFLGYDLGVAITGNENKGITLIITEGFGNINMARKTFDLLKANEGKKTSINGATQIRAGVIRPEIIVPKDNMTEKEIGSHSETNLFMEAGSLIRIIRVPHFGEIATVVSLPHEPCKIETEAKVRTVEVQLENGEKFVLPRANVELIEK